MAKSLATRPVRTRRTITVENLTVTVLNSADVATELLANEADMLDYYAQIAD